jgi:CxxC motif-containing protein (DUF1111 family)
LRLFIDGPVGPRPHASYGAQLNPLAIPGVPAEGRAYVEYLAERGRFGDGTPYVLRRPAYGLFRLAFGQLDEAIRLSPRLAPPLRGLGLLEAVPDAAILALADPDDRNGDGISGRPNWLDTPVGSRQLGRFGWRAEQPTIRRQTASALIEDMGITTTLFPKENCPRPQALCSAAESLGGPDASDEMLDELATYVRMLAPPPSTERHAAGASLFSKAGCSACHTPYLETGESPVGALSKAGIAPYTDLLLHDMGDGLADRRSDGTPAVREWRTAPLWGLTADEAADGALALLHDGRARTIAEAILWHGGEAEAAKEAFRTMSQPDRAALIAFTRSR